MAAVVNGGRNETALDAERTPKTENYRVMPAEAQRAHQSG